MTPTKIRRKRKIRVEVRAETIRKREKDHMIVKNSFKIDKNLRRKARKLKEGDHFQEATVHKARTLKNEAEAERKTKRHKESSVLRAEAIQYREREIKQKEMNQSIKIVKEKDREGRANQDHNQAKLYLQVKIKIEILLIFNTNILLTIYSIINSV